MGKKLYQFGFMHQPRLFASEDIARGVEKKLDSLEVIHRSALKNITLIRESKNLTAKGKQTALKELEEEIVFVTKEWQKENRHYADYAKQLENEMTPIKKRPDDFVGEMRKREIRDYLRTLDPVDLEGRYMAAAESGDELFLSAVDESPIPFTFTTEALVEKTRFSRLERQYPEQALTLKDVRTARQQVDSALGSVAADLRKHGLEIAGDAPVVGVAA